MSITEEWLTLTNVDRLGPITLQKLFSIFNSPAEILAASKETLTKAGASKHIIEGIQNPDANAIEQDLKWLEHDAHYLVTLEDPQYPKQLKQIEDAPIALYVHGYQDLSLLTDPQLAIVGSRNATTHGKQIATTFAEKLAQVGFVITSGLDHVYPAQHRQLAESIAQRGFIVSEFPIGVMPKPGHFPRRNRIISALSLGTLVVEASMKSGSLITARLAADQGREVYAVPGSIHSPLSKGPHSLIRNGAKLVETVEDILIELQHHVEINADTASESKTNTTIETNTPARNPEHEKILHHMGFDPISVDELIERSGFSVEEISSTLLILELDGAVTNNGNGVYVRTLNK